MRYFGILSYPHGGSTTLGLFLATAAAMTATMYGTASCRFFVVTFSSETGGFEEYFANSQAADSGRAVAIYKAGIGLFQWLRPDSPAYSNIGNGTAVVNDRHWADGSCAGYQESMLDQMSNGPFDTARLFGVFAVMASVVMVIWTMLMFCFEMNQYQRILYTAVAFGGTMSTGMTYYMSQSTLCQDLFVTTECSIDEGGMVMTAGLLLWLATTLMGAVFLRETDLVMPDYDGDLSSKRPMTSDDRRKLQIELARQRQMQERREEARAYAAATGSSSQRITPATDRSFSFESPASPDDQSEGSRSSWRRSAPPPKLPRGAAPEVEESLASAPSYGSSAASSSHGKPPLAAKAGLISTVRASLRNAKEKRKSQRSQREEAEDNRAEILVDDVSQAETMEVYISKKLDRIESLARTRSV